MSKRLNSDFFFLCAAQSLRETRPQKVSEGDKEEEEEGEEQDEEVGNLAAERKIYLHCKKPQNLRVTQSNQY